MNPEGWSFVATLAGAVVGGGVTLLATYVQQRHAQKREAAAQEAEADRSRTAEVLALQTLQDALLSFHGQALALGKLATKEGSIPVATFEEVTAEYDRVQVLASRVRDKATREAVHVLGMRLMYPVFVAGDQTMDAEQREKTGRRAATEVHKLYGETQEAIGKRLRELL